MTGHARGQSHVIGVALLLGITVISLGVLTAGIGVLVDRQTASADATRVADGMDEAFAPTEKTGVHRDRLSFAEGTLRPVDRQLRLLSGSTVVRTIDVDALVFTSGDRRVAYVAGAIVRGRSGEAWFQTEPRIAVGERVLLVSAPTIGWNSSVSGRGGVTIEQNVTHQREQIGNGSYAVAIETATPGPFVRQFTDRGATVERRDLDGDGVESAVVTFPGERRTYLAVHDLAVEVT